MSRFTRKTALPKSPPRLPLGYSKVSILNVSKPVLTEVEGKERYTTRVTFKSVNSETELSIDCVCFLSQGSRLDQIFSAVHCEYELDGEDDWCLKDLVSKELIVLVEEKESKNGRMYYSITQFLPVDALVETVSM